MMLSRAYHAGALFFDRDSMRSQGVLVNAFAIGVEGPFWHDGEVTAHRGPRSPRLLPRRYSFGVFKSAL